MSGMSTRGRPLLVVIACLLGAGGCHGLRTPPSADPAMEDPASGVVAASATEPLSTESNRFSSVRHADFESLYDDSLAGPGKEAEFDALSWDWIDPAKVHLQIKTLIGYGPNEHVARALFDEGEELYRRKQYDAAAKNFAAAADRWSHSLLEEDAMFLLAESLFFADHYSKAFDAYDQLLQKHGNSRHLDTVAARLFAIGRYWDQLDAHNPHWPVTPNLTDSERPWFDTFGNAMKAYDLVWVNDPTGPLADDAVMAAGGAYLSRGRYVDAAFFYDMLRTAHPKSEHQVEAHLLAVGSKLEAYQGPGYDGAILNEAGEIAQQALIQFPDQLGPQRDRLLQTRARIADGKAARDWEIAHYYDKTKHYGAARYYYRLIMHDHPRSRYAERAQARLEEIHGKPDDPPDRFRWLVELFPSDE